VEFGVVADEEGRERKGGGGGGGEEVGSVLAGDDRHEHEGSLELVVLLLHSLSVSTANSKIAGIN